MNRDEIKATLDAGLPVLAADHPDSPICHELKAACSVKSWGR